MSNGKTINMHFFRFNCFLPIEFMLILRLQHSFQFCKDRPFCEFTFRVIFFISFHIHELTGYCYRTKLFCTIPMFVSTFLLALWITITRSLGSRRRKRSRRGLSLVRLSISRNRPGMVAILMECQYRRSSSRVIRPTSWGLRRTGWLEQLLVSRWSQTAFRRLRPLMVSEFQPWNWKRTPKAPNKPHLPVKSTNQLNWITQVNRNTKPKLLGKQHREPLVFWIQISPILNMTTKSKSQIFWIIICDIFNRLEHNRSK